MAPDRDLLILATAGLAICASAMIAGFLHDMPVLAGRPLWMAKIAGFLITVGLIATAKVMAVLT